MSKLVPTIPVAILIAPIFILRFSRTQPARRGNLLTLLGFVLSINVGLWGLFDLDDGALSLLFEFVRSSLLGVLYFLPYMIDRWIYPKFRNMGTSAALIFPTVTTAIFFLSSLEGPFDGTVQASKFVYGPTIAQQLLSLLGIWAFIFISSWFASLINYVWENDFDWRRSRKTAITFIASQMDSAEAGDGILYAEVPTRGINTVYTTLGDLLGWLCVLGSGAFVVFSIISRASKRSERSRSAVFG